VVVLRHVAIQVVLEGGSGRGMEKAFGVAACVAHVGQAVGAGSIAVGVRELVDDAVGIRGCHQSAAGIGFDVPVLVERDVAFGVAVGVDPDCAVVRPVVGGNISLPLKIL
jgi:hypothetical protein